MKEIKYRAWDKLRNIICNVLAIDFEKRNCKIEYNKNWEVTLDFYKIISRLDDVVLLQFIGCHDKNKKEIYEGDIVRLVYPDFDMDICDKQATITGVVMYSNDKFYVKQLIDDTYTYGCGSEDNLEFYDYMDSLFTWSELEIIGNMYENSLLLGNKGEIIENFLK